MEFVDLVEIQRVGKTRYCVEAANELNPDDGATVIWNFHDAGKAQACAEKLQAAGFSCVWLSEWGSWITNQGNEKRGWVHYWWTPACGFKPEPAQSGRGIVESDGVKGKLRDYLPKPRS